MHDHTCALAPQGSRPHALSPAYRGPIEAVEREAWLFRLSNVAHSRTEKCATLARVCGREQAAGHSTGESVYGGRNGHTDAAADNRCAERYAGGRGGDRLGRGVGTDFEVTHAARISTFFPNILTQSADPFDIVPSAWRNGRPSKPATTVTPDLFELAGIRAAKHWLKVRPTARPNQWCRSTFDNLVAGLGRIPSYANCLAAFERSFKRRIEAASRADRKAMEVRV